MVSAVTLANSISGRDLSPGTSSGEVSGTRVHADIHESNSTTSNILLPGAVTAASSESDTMAALSALEHDRAFVTDNYLMLHRYWLNKYPLTRFFR